MDKTKLKGISLRSPEEIQKELITEWCWNIKNMAANYHRSTDEMLHLIQFGGETYEKNRHKENNEKLVKASYDVTFCPMTNVEVLVADPAHPTVLEMNEIIGKAIGKVIADVEDKICDENVESVTLWSINDVEVENPHPLKPEGIDTQILVELTALAYKELYDLHNDGVMVFNIIRRQAELLTKKYWETDWKEKDFWLTMEAEAEALVKKEREEHSCF